MNTEFVALTEQTDLAHNIAKHFGKDLFFPKIDRFADGELRVRLEEPNRFHGKKVVLIQSTCSPVHENLMLVALAAHALKQAGVVELIGVLPYFGYSRHDKSEIAGEPGPIEVVIKLLEAAGIDRFITIELHAPEAVGLFSVPVQNVGTASCIANHIKHHFTELEDFCLVSPDKGAEQHVKKIADMLGIGYVVYEKERLGVDQTRIVGKIMECAGHRAILIDDIIDTGGTARNACNELMTSGFSHVYAYFVHPVFSGEALEKMHASTFDTIYVGNTIALPKDKPLEKVRSFDVSQLIIQELE